jgi:hypothetical protein
MSEINTGRRFPFAIMPLWIVDHPNLEALDVAVYVAIKRHADREGDAHPSRQTIARLAKVSIKTVDRSVDRLIEIGALEKFARRNPNGDPTSNRYIIHEVPRKEGGSVSQTLGGVSQSPGVASERRTELHPIELEDVLDYSKPADTSEWTPPPAYIKAMLQPPTPPEAA